MKDFDVKGHHNIKKYSWGNSDQTKNYDDKNTKKP